MSQIDWTNFNSSLLIEVTRANGVFTSSGVAINEKTILTAAHCLEGEVLSVRVCLESQYDKNGRFLEGEGFVLHPEYQPEKSHYRNDLAKITLKEKLPGEMKIYPIMKKKMDLSGKIFRLGFGGRNNINARTLVTPQFKQVRSFEDVLELHDTYSYSGDSGGPVYLQERGQLFLVAIHSTLSFGPEGKYSFNPLLSSHREWINQTI
jgi:V8-like Glu-specific endopeptidase